MFVNKRIQLYLSASAKTLIFEFNKTRVPFTQKETPILINYVIKNKDEIIAGINTCMYHWKILFVYVLFVKENHRHEKLGSFLL